MAASRFVVGIDLGTTNMRARLRGHRAPGTARRARPCPSRRSSTPAWSRTGRCCRRSSTCPGPNEQPAGSLKLPWDPNRDYAVGEFARNFGSQVPTRLVSSAPSRGCATRASIAGRRSCRGRPPRAAARSRRWRRARATSSTWPRRGTPRSPRTSPDHRLEAAGHHPDRAGVVRRRGPRADRRSRPRRRVREPDPARGAAGRVLRLARRAPATTGGSRSRSAT